MTEPVLNRCNVRTATHVKVDGRIERIASTWGINRDGVFAKPSQGGFGVVTETGRRVSMWDAHSYYLDASRREHDHEQHHDRQGEPDATEGAGTLAPGQHHQDDEKYHK